MPHARWWAALTRPRTPEGHLARLQPSCNGARANLGHRRARPSCGRSRWPLARRRYDLVSRWIHSGPTTVDNGRAVHRLCKRLRRVDDHDAAPFCDRADGSRDEMGFAS